MNILLIEPNEQETYGRMKGLVNAYPPLNLLYLASIIREKRKDNVKVLDLQVVNKHFSELDILKKKWDIIGITSVTAWFPATIKISEIIKKINPETKILIGGSHITTLPEEILKHDSLDIAVIGEGEITIIELLDHLEKNKPLDNVKGIAFKKENKLIITEHRHLIENLDSLPYPAYDLINIWDYDHPVQRKEPYAAIMASRGCAAQCAFCCKEVFGSKIRKRDPKKVVDEIEYLSKHFGVKEIRFTDDTFTFIRDYAISIAKEILNRKLDIVWRCSVRADRCDYELLSIMKKAGCYGIGVGVESGSQKILDDINKGIKIDQVVKTFEYAKKVGLETSSFFIIGFPNDTAETIKETIEFAKKINSTITKFSFFTPLPGSPLFKKLKEENKLLTENWEEYKFHNKPIYKLNHLTPEEVIKLYKKAYRSIYLRPNSIINIISSIKNTLVLKRRFNSAFIVMKMFFKK